MNKKISVCVAIHNIREDFLRQCIESLILDKSEDIEIILGDDCSAFICRTICLEYAKKDNRIKYIRLSQNLGVSVLRNTMMDEASGDVITFVDADDAVSEDYIKKVRIAANTENDIVMYQLKRFWGKIPESENNDSIPVSIPIEAARVFSISCMTGRAYDNESYGVNNSTPSSVCIKTYKKSFLERYNLRFEKGLKKSQDTVFNTRAFYYCRSLGYIDEVLYFYRKNPDSICNRYSGDFENIMNNCIEYDKKNLKELYNNDAAVKRDFNVYKIIKVIIENFSLNIFHKDNPHTIKERKTDFDKFIETEQYRDFLNNFNYNEYDWNERKLVLRLAKKKRFHTLNFFYTFPFAFRVYGKLKRILSKLIPGDF